MPPVATGSRRLTTSTFVVLAGSGIAVLASLALRVVLARLLVPAELGLLLLGIAVVTVAGGAASLGLNLAASRDVAALRAVGRAAAAARLAVRVAVVAGISGLLASLALVAGAPLLAGWFGAEGDAGALTPVLRALSPVVLGLSLGLAALGVYRAYDRVVARAVLRDAGGGVLRAVVVTAVGLVFADLVTLAAAYGAAVLASESLFLAHSLRRSRREARAAVPVEAPPEAGGAVPPLSPRRLAPFAGLEILGQMQAWFDVLLLGLFVAPAELAAYALARALTRSLDLVRGAAAHRFLPTAAQAAARGERGELGAMQRHAVGLVLLLIALPTAVFLLLPGVLMELLFGAPYRAAGPLLAVLAVTVLLEAVFGFHELVLLAHGREGGVLTLRVVSQGVGIAALVVLAPPFGALGAAWAVVTMQAVRSAGVMVMARREAAVER